MSKFNPQEVKNDLVENALKFLMKSVKDFEVDLQFSVIHFYSSVELFFKARLLDEHWTLLYEKPESANVVEFMNGDFVSVTLRSSLNRLQNISQDSIGKPEQKCFDKIRLHRNKALHFYHNFHKPDLQSLKDEIISLQCQGWGMLYNLISKKWSASFSHYRRQIDDCNDLMHRQRKYLTGKYELTKPKIAQLETEGVKVENCVVCGFKACLISPIHGPLFHAACLVCEKGPSLIKVDCPDCGQPVYSQELGEGKCGSCSKEIDMDFLIEELDEDTSSPRDISMGEGGVAHCSECEYSGGATVIQVQGRYLCLNCHLITNELNTCDFCGARINGDDEMTIVNCCSNCNF
jgi:hypothetical protein